MWVNHKDMANIQWLSFGVHGLQKGHGSKDSERTKGFCHWESKPWGSSQGPKRIPQ